jgi:DNA primase
VHGSRCGAPLHALAVFVHRSAGERIFVDYNQNARDRTCVLAVGADDA